MPTPPLSQNLEINLHLTLAAVAERVTRPIRSPAHLISKWQGEQDIEWTRI
jgi:hypothetical protein